jgi:hypothetical protein
MSGYSFLTVITDGDGRRWAGPPLFLLEADWDLARKLLVEFKADQLLPASTRLDGIYVGEHEEHFGCLELNPNWVAEQVPLDQFPLTFSKN